MGRRTAVVARAADGDMLWIGGLARTWLGRRRLHRLINQLGHDSDELPIYRPADLTRALREQEQKP